MSVSTQLGEVREVEVAAGRVRYRERGSGPVLLFLHGVLVNGDLWRKVVPLLAGDFRCITPDLPLGAHEVPLRADADVAPPAVAALVADFLEALDLRDVTIVANDSGGAITQMLLTTRPERVARVVLTPCDAFEKFPPAMFSYLKLVAQLPGGLAAMAPSMRWRPVLAAPNAFGWLMHELPPREIIDSWGTPLRRREIRRDTRKFLKGLSPRHTLDAAARFGSVRQPVLVAWGADDKFFAPELGRRLAQALPNARFELIEGARTFAPEDRPDRIAQLVREFARAEEVRAAAS